ncbi:DUF2478 domain-containing protein [Paracoccus jeotgali]|uniref:3-dehydroquinate dehydratase n=1 Tax=Paracoccus jeotgali TaxID=2065379 RepID=A0A2K9MGZ9_9RHOB|nr:DUF2478 domain-containing protein [Paracoccus jeotgali]AUM74762.1 hypothetical protein CYR75_11155 [Paracoccus jeotgali]
MLGWLDHADTGGGDGAHARLSEIAATLAAEGLAVRGTVQTNLRRGGDDCHCDMVLRVLADDGPQVVISQDLGAGSQGCRLDADALEGAAQRVLATLPEGVAEGGAIVVLNKFGKQEMIGRGMVAVITAALDRGFPVLISVAPAHRPAFAEFAGELAVHLSPEAALEWCRDALAAARLTPAA